MTLARLRPPDKGALFVISGPSGVGKSTLLRGALATVPGLTFSVSATTRAPRPGEQDGVDYHFYSRERFDALLSEEAFLEHATVYGRSYGTLLEPTQAALDQGRSLLLDIDVQGARQIRERLPDSVHLMVAPPSIPALERRLRARGTDSEEVIARRMAELAEQLGAIEDYDYVVVNDDLTTARRQFEGVILAELSRVRRHPGLVHDLRAALG